MTQEYLTTDEVSALLRMNRETVYRLLAQRKIPGKKVGNRWFIGRSVLDAFLKETPVKE